MSEADVGTPSAAYEAMMDRWRLPTAMLGGTWALREHALATSSPRTRKVRLSDAEAKRSTLFDYLPQNELETDAAYVGRVSRSVLTNYYKQAVEHIVGRGLAKPVQLEEDVPAVLREYAEDVDLTGQHLSLFARRLFTDGWVYGKAHFLVDQHPPEPVPLPNGQTLVRLEDARQQGVRPYFVHVAPSQLIGWRSARVAGREVVTQLRIREVSTEPDGEFGEREVERIRRYYLKPEGAVFELWEKTADDKAKWVQVGDTRPLGMPEIPFVTFYVNRTGPLQSLPPLEDLAFVNLRHWQSSSDQANILHLARVPILFSSGISWENDSTARVGADGLIEGPQGSTLEWVELTGKSMEAGRQDILDCAEQMAVMGMEPLIPRTGNTTATARALDEARSAAPVEVAVDNLKDALERGLGYMARWRGMAGDAGGSVIVESAPPLSLSDANLIEALIKARAAGDLSRETFLEALAMRPNLLPDSFTIEQEQQRLAGESMTPGPEGETRGRVREALRAQGRSDDEIDMLLDGEVAA